MSNIYTATMKYKILIHKFGCYEIVRHDDNASCFFQGDDASIFEKRLNRIEEFTPITPHTIFATAIDRLCGDYDHVLTANNKEIRA